MSLMAESTIAVRCCPDCRRPVLFGDDRAEVGGRVCEDPIYSDVVPRRYVALDDLLAFLRSAGDTRFWNESFKAAAAVIDREFGGVA